MVWISFTLCIMVILFAGGRLARYADIIAEKTGLSGAWLGTVLVAVVTSLPELFTGISSVTLVNAPDLTVGNLLGASVYNLLNLALLDIVYRNETIIRAQSSVHRLTAWFSLIVIALVGVSILVSKSISIPSLGWIGWYSPVLVALYLVFTRTIYRAERTQLSLRRQEKQVLAKYATVAVRTAYSRFTVFAILIIGAGIGLATVGDRVAEITGWGRSFVGTLLIAFTTTLPEISVSAAAMRIGAVDLAIANMVGSTLLNMVIVATDDLFYVRGPILSYVSPNHLATILALVLMLLLFIAALHFKPRGYMRLSWWNCATIALFLASAYFSFALSR